MTNDIRNIALLSLVFFVALTGGEILHPYNLDWSIGENKQIADTEMFFIGWAFFSNTSFIQFPFLANFAYGEELGFPLPVSDSIPLMAILSRPFSNLFSIKIGRAHV